MGVDPAAVRRLGLGLAACVLLGAVGTASAAELKVTTTADGVGPPAGGCSLREAIVAVDSPGTRTACGAAGPRANTIVLTARRYVLSLTPAGDDDERSGDLNVTGRGSLTIVGRGPRATAIDASGLGDRVLSVAGGSRVTLHGLSLTGGRPPSAAAGFPGLDGVDCSLGGAGGHGYSVGIAGDGGGIYNAGSLLLSHVAVLGNRSAAGGPGGSGGSQSGGAPGCGGGGGGVGGSGGGIYNQGALTVIDSTIAGNSAGAGGPGGAGGGSTGGPPASDNGGQGGDGGPGGSGGGIYNQGTLSISASTLYGNLAGVGGPGGPGGAEGPTGPGGAAAGTALAGNGGPGGSGGSLLSAAGDLTVENSTLAGSLAGAGGAAGGPSGSGGDGGDGGAIAVVSSLSIVRDSTLADDGVGPGGPGVGRVGLSGRGGGLFVQSEAPSNNMQLENTIVASSLGAGCAESIPGAIGNGGHDLRYGDNSCPGQTGNPKLGPLQNNGGATDTMALGAGSAAINRVPGRHADCPATDERGVRRPAGKRCDIGAYEFALPTIKVLSPTRHGSYKRGSRLVVRFRCTEGGLTSLIVSCHGSLPRGHRIATKRVRRGRLVITATDRSGHRTRKTVPYSIWTYANPLRRVAHLSPERIDMGVDYAGAGPLLAIGEGRVTVASNSASGPGGCRGITCWPGGGAVIYRLLDGPFAGKSVYLAENIHVTVRKGQIVRAGQQVAILRPGSPHLETGWASGRGPETLAIADRHQCLCGDPGGWTSIEGRNFDQLLVRLGAPSGRLQPNPPAQSMPRGWPSWRR